MVKACGKDRHSEQAVDGGALAACLWSRHDDQRLDVGIRYTSVRAAP